MHHSQVIHNVPTHGLANPTLTCQTAISEKTLGQKINLEKKTVMRYRSRSLYQKHLGFV